MARHVSREVIVVQGLTIHSDDITRVWRYDVVTSYSELHSKHTRYSNFVAYLLKDSYYS